MQQTSSNDQRQWKTLIKSSNDEKPPAYKNYNYRKLLLSKDHLILLTNEDNFVYTFHLKDFSWTKHNINRKSTKSMSWRSCIARPGLIVDLNSDSDRWTLELLTFDTGGVPTNFCQTSKGLKRNQLGSFGYLNSFGITADSTSVYLFGGRMLRNSESSYFNTLYQVEIDFGEDYALDVDGIKPSIYTTGERCHHNMTIYEDRIYIFGGKDSKDKPLSDLWVFNLSEKKWKQLNDGKDLKGSELLFAQQDRVLLYSDQYGSTMSYDLCDSSWEIIDSKIAKSETKIFALHGNSLICLSDSELYSLNISILTKTKKCLEKQPENFMTKLYENKNFADVIFQVEDQEFPAIKCLLTARCSYFNNVFTSNMMESQNKIIPVKNVRAEVFKVMLEYLYFIEVQVKCEIAEDLFKLCHEYGLENLKNDCEDLLTLDIRVDNVIKKIQLAKLYEANKLQQACLAFIFRNKNDAFLKENIRELDKETLFELYKTKD